MNFKRLNLSVESGKSEQESIASDFLQEQARLTKDQWSEEFRKMVEEKSRENQQNQENFNGTGVEKSPETLREDTYNRYINGLGLNEEFLRGKRVLDIGSGNGDFVKSLIEKNITSEAYGIDAELNKTAVEDRFKQNFFQGNFEDDLPVQNIDYMVSVGAISNGFWGSEERMNVRRIIDKSLASLKIGGEIRIYPIQEAAKATPLKGLLASQKKWRELFLEISETRKVKCEIIPRNINVSGKNNDIILQSVLVISRKTD